MNQVILRFDIGEEMRYAAVSPEHHAEISEEFDRLTEDGDECFLTVVEPEEISSAKDLEWLIGDLL